VIDTLTKALLATVRDVAALSVLLLGFQLFVLRQPIPHLKRVLVGLGLAVLGLAFFLVGLELALFPLGQLMATQLSSPEFVFGATAAPDSPRWWRYGWIYLFAAIIGFATTLAEPALIAVASKAKQASRGTVRPWGLRLVVAVGVGAGLSLGTFRIVTGTSLVLFIAVGYQSRWPSTPAGSRHRPLPFRWSQPSAWVCLRPFRGATRRWTGSG
jgi:hypothetical protein